MNNLDQQLDRLADTDATDPSNAFLGAVAQRRAQRRARTAACGVLIVALCAVLVFIPASPPPPAPMAAARPPVLGPRLLEMTPGRPSPAIPVGLRFNAHALDELAADI